MIPVPEVVMGVLAMAGLIVLIRHVRREDAEFDAAQSPPEPEPVVEGAPEYVPIHELEF